MTDKETELPDIDHANTIVQETMSNLIDSADVTKVYGRPIKQGDITVVPASENLTFLGFGVGAGGGESIGENSGPGSGGGAAEEGARSPGRWRLLW